MRLRQFKTLFAVLVSAFLVSCKGSGPIVDVCLSFPQKGGFVCVDKYQNAYFLDYKESLKYVAFSPDDAQKIIQSCGMSGRQNTYVMNYLTKVNEIASREVIVTESEGTIQ